MNAPQPCVPSLAKSAPVGSEAEPVRTRWFKQEVQVHEGSLRAYLRGVFPAVRDVDDVVQESFLRVWRARSERSIDFAKSFLFRVAKHLALDLVKRQHHSPIIYVGDLTSLDVFDDRADVAREVSIQEKVRLLALAIDALPARCREVVILRKLQYVSQKEVAACLGLSEKTVEVQLSRGVKRCEEYLRTRGVQGCFDDEPR